MDKQTDMILAYLREHGSITPIEAMKEFGCMRLAARIADLKAAGHLINTFTETSMNKGGYKVRYARYELVEGK